MRRPVGGPPRMTFVQPAQDLARLGQLTSHLAFDQRQPPQRQRQQEGQTDNLVIPPHIQRADADRTIRHQMNISFQTPPTLVWTTVWTSAIWATGRLVT